MKGKARTWCAALIVMAAATLIVAPAAGAEGTANWQILQRSRPTNLVPGSLAQPSSETPAFFALVENVGAVSSDPTTVVDTLPAGVTTSSSTTPKLREYDRALAEKVNYGCAVAGRTVTCVAPQTIEPGDFVEVEIPIDVSPEASGELSNEMVVEGSSGPVATDRTTSLVSEAIPPFGFVGAYGLFGSAFDEAGEAPHAGAHPFVATFGFETPSVSLGTSSAAVEGLRSVRFSLPEGLVVDPLATPRCPIATFIGSARSPARLCAPEAQVGTAAIYIGQLYSTSKPVYNLIPPPGVPAELGFTIQGNTVTLLGGLSSGFRLTAESSEILTRYAPSSQVNVALWGVPSDPGHDEIRQGEGCERYGFELVEFKGPCPVSASSAPFLSMPSSCGPMTVSASVSSWLGHEVSATRPFTTEGKQPLDVTGCGQLAFEPTIASKATTGSGESTSGLEFSIHQPQDESLDGRATATLKDATVALPEGMTLNPSAANGLSACTEQQMGYAPEEGKIRFATTPNTCPDAAKVGTLSVHTPLLEEDQPGSIYVAKPFDNPFGSLLAIYLAVEDETTGIVAKLAGKVTPDPATGRLTATFTENPELPLEDIDLQFFPGDHGVLTTPLTCGTATTTTTLTPWSTPEGADTHPSDSFQVSSSCSASEGAAPKGYFFRAGTQSPLSGAYSPFVLRIDRGDGTQHIAGIDTMLPPGLLGKLAGVAYCPESGIAEARSREVAEQGKIEQTSPSCPSSSEVGTVNVTAGSGNSPIPVSGHTYLAGPYKGAPLSLVVIVPAVAGPFDLGTVVDRVALNVNPYTARIEAVADPLPTIREGIPLDVRSIELKLDRPSFTLNPTSCEAMQIEGSVSTQAGQSQSLSNRFQVGECGRLAFKPKLQISLKGPTKRTGHPALKAVVTYPQQGAYANIARAQVNLPHSEFLDQGNIGKACTKVILAQRACPARSIYGKAKAWSPLLEKPLEGPVYLVGGYGYKLPALVAELDGQIRVLLVGKIDTGKNKGIRNTFEAVPDAPVSRFVLELKGGKKYGLLENSQDVCSKAQKAGVSFRAQNGKVLQTSAKISNSCKGGHEGKGRQKPNQPKNH
jgi:hypothetical protein